jgi:hypothetical protein
VDPLARELVHTYLTWSGDRDVQGEVRKNGTFRLVGVGRSRGKLSVWVLFRRGGSTTVEVDDIEPDGPDVELVIPAPPRLLARVEGLAPEARLTVGLLSAGATSAREGPLADGRLDVAPVTGEPVLLVLHAEGMAPTVVEVPALSPGEERDLGILALGAGRDIAGRVRALGDAPVGAAEVRVAERWSEARTTTDAEGRFVLPRMPARGILLRVRARGFPQHLFTLPARTDGELEVRLTPGGAVQGVAVDAAGRPVEGAGVVVTPAFETPYDRDHDATRVSVDAGPGGLFSVRLSAGRHRIRAYRERLRSEPREIEVHEGRVEELRLVLDRPADR